MTTAAGESTYPQQVLAYEQTAYDAAINGDYNTAITVWSSILADADMVAFFSQEGGAALQEIGWNLAVAYCGQGELETGKEIFARYGFKEADYLPALEASAR